MKLHFIAFAIPFFLFFIALEYFLSKKKKRDIYHVNETIANLNVGIAERLCDIITTGLFFYFFSFIYQHFAIFYIQANWITWILLFLATDFLWYWYHRFGHVVNLFWAVHVVHHQSEDFNFTVSARITILQSAARSLFWSFLPLLGFPPSMVLILLLIHGAYPFFTHTQLIGKLGWIEYLFVTPSHHRVHHSSNKEYLDKNYGDVLIIWDKIFGTFAEEKAAPVYGLTTPLNSYSFLWQHFHFFLELGVSLKRAKGIRKKLQILFGKPELIDPRIQQFLHKKLSSPNRQHQLTKTVLDVIKAETFTAVIILFFTILFFNYINSWQALLITFFILLGVVATGAMLEQRRWIFHLEYARLVLLFFFLHSIFPNTSLLYTGLGMLFGVLLFYRTITGQYYKLLYK